jgi:DNA helicase-2/ATP-dependent DNA helicase PcrA
MFLTEVRAGCEDGAGRIDVWAQPPADDAENPVLAQPLTASWPVAPSAAGARFTAVQEGGELVRAAIAARAAGAPDRARADRSGPGAGTGSADRAGATDPAAGSSSASRVDLAGPADGSTAGARAERHAALMAGWTADADLLLAERSRRRPDGPVPVELPHRIAVTSLVAMADDPAGLAARIRRPMPAPPAPGVRRGTAFHRWLEERFGQQRLIDREELAGAEDAGLIADDAALLSLKTRFDAGEWGRRWPADVEVRFETRVSDRLVRGRIDAVFTDSPRGGIDLVDWKTGTPPEPYGQAERSVAVQLAAYRLAWAALTGVPLEQVRAAFYYVRQDRTVRPTDLLDADGLAALITTIPLAAPLAPS